MSPQPIKYHLKVTILFLMAILALPSTLLAATTNTQIAGIQDEKTLNETLQQKKDRINQLQDQINEYQKNIDYQKKQSLSLSNQISILTNEVGQLETEIDLKNNQIEATQLEIEQTTEKINNTTNNIEIQKNRLGEFIKTMNRLDQKSTMEIILSVDNFSEYYNHLHTLSLLEDNTKDSLSELKDFKTNLEKNHQLLEAEKKNLNSLLNELDQKKSNLEQRSYTKQTLLKESRNSEAKFTSLVSQLKSEQNSINADIVALEKKFRQNSGNQNLLAGLGANFTWPTASHVINTYFHDPDYPFRYVYEHPGLDLKSSQGSPIKAAASGYVATAKNAGMGYSYIMLIHDDGFSTVYGHISKILVKPDQFINAGETIGLSGGMPGTPGAGRMTTGPHLHFEIRKNGIPVNPLDYLP